jgi:hypothetical protein
VTTFNRSYLWDVFGGWHKNPKHYTSALTDEAKAHRKMRNKMRKKSTRINRLRNSRKGSKTQ